MLFKRSAFKNVKDKLKIPSRCFLCIYIYTYINIYIYILPFKCICILRNTTNNLNSQTY